MTREHWLQLMKKSYQSLRKIYYVTTMQIFKKKLLILTAVVGCVILFTSTGWTTDSTRMGSCLNLVVDSFSVGNPIEGGRRTLINYEWARHSERPKNNTFTSFQPVTAVPSSQRRKYRVTWRGLSLPVLTSANLGRLGNVMGEYATLFALGKIYNASVVLLPSMEEVLKMFPGLSMLKFPGSFKKEEWIRIGYCNQLYNYTDAELAASGSLGPRLFYISDTPFEIQLFNAYREDIIREFTFSDELLSTAQQFLHKKKMTRNGNSTEPVTFIGFHIRRSDYKKHMKRFQGSLPEHKYFANALDYYRRKFSNPLFVMASDDRSFISNFTSTDIVIAPGNSPAVDMATLASCNHSIITLGSFGFWTGYLAGGEVVYPVITTGSPYRFSKEFFYEAGLYFFTGLPVS